MQELELVSVVVGKTEVLCCLQHYENRVPPTDRVLRFLEVVVENRWVQSLDGVHSLPIHVGNLLVDRQVTVSVIRRKAESVAPMAEVGGDDEQVLRVLHVVSENVPICLLTGSRQGSDEDGDDGVATVAHDLGDEGELHLDTVLGFFVPTVHQIKVTRRTKFFVD